MVNKNVRTHTLVHLPNVDFLVFQLIVGFVACSRESIKLEQLAVLPRSLHVEDLWAKQ